MANAKTAEWMFGDASTGILGFHGLADLNPLRWSGPLTFDKCVAQLEKTKEHGDRPIIVKVPAGVSSREKKCGTVDEAIEYVKSKDPRLKSLKDQFEQACSELKEAEAILAEKNEEEKKAEAALQNKRAALGAAPSVMTMWMYSNPETPLGGFGRFFAQFDPIRWSDMQTAARTIKDLEGLKEHHAKHNEAPRGIRLLEQSPTGDVLEEGYKDYASEDSAIERLKELIVVDDPELHALEDKLEESRAHVKDAKKNVESAQHFRDEKDQACKAAGV